METRVFQALPAMKNELIIDFLLVNFQAHLLKTKPKVFLHGNIL